MLNRNNNEGVPKYLQLARILKDQILEGNFQDDEQIPTEQVLCADYEVSRITVRQAINTLVQEKLLYREQGRGTYVLPKKLKRDITRIYSFTTDMINLGLRPGSSLVEQTIVEAEPGIAEKLKLPAGDGQVLRIVRLREANDIPVLYETTLIPHFLCPDLYKADLVKGSLYQILMEQYKLLPLHAEETYEAIIMSEQHARLLQCKSLKNQPALSIQRIAYLENMVPLEFTTSVGRGDRLTLAVNMVAESAKLQRMIEL